MLQLPAQNSRRFTRQQLAEMSRGAKTVKTKPSADPAIKLIKAADSALKRYIRAGCEVYEIAQRMNEADTRHPSISPPDEFKAYFVENFCSIGEINSRCRAGLARNRQRIAHYRKTIRRSDLPEQLREEVARHLGTAEACRQQIPRARQVMSRMFRAEKARIDAIWRQTGYGAALFAQQRAARALAKATMAVARSKPKTPEGALALLNYCASRSFEGRGSIPEIAAHANICRLLYDVHAFMAKQAKEER